MLCRLNRGRSICSEREKELPDDIRYVSESRSSEEVDMGHGILQLAINGTWDFTIGDKFETRNYILKYLGSTVLADSSLPCNVEPRWAVQKQESRDITL